MSDLYDLTGGGKQKTKTSNIHHIPFWAALLVVASKEYFHTHYEYRLSSLLRQLKKDRIKTHLLLKVCFSCPLFFLFIFE